MSIQTRIPALFVALLCTALGCPSDDGGGETTNNTSPTTSDTDATTTGMSTSMTTMDTMSTSMSTSMTTMDTMSTSMTTTDTDPSSTGPDPDSGTAAETGASACDPEPDDDKCSMCTKKNCCDELEACYANPDCECAVTCISDMGLAMMQACLDKCMIEAVPQEGNDLQTCVATSGCLGVCV